MRHPVILLVLALAVGAAVVACSAREVVPPSNGEGFLPPVQLVHCPKFDLTTTEINVGPAGGSFPIGPNHTLEFWPGAVRVPATYLVQKGPEARSRGWAQIHIQPVGQAPRTFGADVILDLSYRSCELGDLAGDLVLVKTSPPQRGIGGRDDRGRQALRALLPHLSMFAIAH